MLLSALFATAISAPLVFGQVAYDSDHNVTSLRGTWGMSAEGHVLTGPGFYNPLTRSFTVPDSFKNLNSWVWTYSFTDNGFWERCTYQPSSAIMENCKDDGANLYYQHGTYELLSNGSIALTPFANDGTLEVRNKCLPDNGTQPYGDPSLIESWGITEDHTGPVLHLDLPHLPGFKLPLVYDPPNMLPTHQINNNTRSA
ncbi:chaperone for protein-folding within the ER, fungal-domain-containing protein [Rhizoctonia solani]|nr:chaperone for protein-folding within the ER, fungal-domain-containing protein [Rhizoctonia solani]